MAGDSLFVIPALGRNVNLGKLTVYRYTEREMSGNYLRKLQFRCSSTSRRKMHLKSKLQGCHLVSKLLENYYHL